MDHAQATLSNPVYDSSDRNFRSKHIYFYYLRAHGAGEAVRAYHIKAQTPLRHDEMKAEVKRLAKWVKDENPPAQGTRLGEIPWTHKSYFAAVLDDDEALEVGNAFTFGYRAAGGPNHSFFDGVDITDMEGDLSGFFCVNHMRGRHGNDLGNESEVFHVEANHSHGHAHLASRAKAAETLAAPLFSHTDSGTNTGPPQP